MNGQLNPQQIKAAELMAADVAKTMNLEEIAQEVGVSRNTLYSWRKQDEFQAYLRKQIKSNLSERLPYLLSLGIKFAEKGSGVHFTQLLKAAEFTNVTPTEPTYEKSSDDRKAEIRAKLAALEAERAEHQ